jgi:ankyrin repeat protein
MCSERHSRSVVLLLWLQYGQTAFEIAVRHGHDKVVDVMVRAGLDYAADEVRPLSMAASHGHDKIADVLVQAGADVNAANKVRPFPILRFLALHCDCEQ